MTQASFVTKAHNPDVLTCIANLSNDEVFTPPELANQILDSLEKTWAMSNAGENLWTNKNLTFLDPCAKSGVFLREIVKRLSEGLSKEIPDLTERINHILTKQVFGIGITELTSLLARRTIYCSKNANGIHSVARTFPTSEGNIWYERVEHDWNSGRCNYCGANANEYARSDEMETHAYKFIHTSNPENLTQDLFGGNMHFDVVIGNPPYQLSVGNTTGNSSKARAIYHEFISQAIALNPRYIAMIVPSRWMTRSTEGIPDSWIDSFIDDHRVRVLHDFLDSKICFPGLDIKGGVCYFLWDRDNEGKCEYVLHSNSSENDVIRHEDYLNSKGIGIVVRDNKAISIIEKIEAVEGDWLTNSSKNFSSLVSPKDFFTNKVQLTSSWDGFTVKKSGSNSIKYYLNKAMHGVPYGFIKLEDVPKNTASIKLDTVFIPAAAWGVAKEEDDPVLGQPFVGEANSACSQTYLVIGYDPIHHNFSKEQCENIVSYISTKFFRYLVSLKKRTQNGPRHVYQFVPVQDFSKPWTDKELYKKYKLTQDEIAFIEKMIRPMVLRNE
jgi:site-specific DNA-methyltransferase (adenine-specific)